VEVTYHQDGLSARVPHRRLSREPVLPVVRVGAKISHALGGSLFRGSPRQQPLGRRAHRSGFSGQGEAIQVPKSVFTERSFISKD